MKKIIWPLIFILIFGISIYTVTNYNKNKSKDSDIITKETPTQSTTVPNESTDIKKDNPTEIVTNPEKIAALDFKLKDLNGKDVSLSDFKGKKVMLNFWASWCRPCMSEMPDIQKLYNETKDSDLVILAVNLSEDKATVKSFADINKYNFTILLDSEENVGRQYTITAIPTTFFIDKEGNIISTVKGAITLEKMRMYISKL
ncbi:TlpA family protein disulfide reductase [Clostridium sp. CS001]|uniref:TlpA disulfide reductase family protein n=1 Tax=Clostridium sp. CS001 TaxID=2880648 RepID=UPI001CF5C45A|nr:TlpA disulfide reductase family protein [Clostridium sp. CS001]MCB2289273.1 TlpA family protein disulfide reductase [Clostridium sp. CS001]